MCGTHPKLKLIICTRIKVSGYPSHAFDINANYTYEIFGSDKISNIFKIWYTSVLQYNSLYAYINIHKKFIINYRAY